MSIKRFKVKTFNSKAGESDLEDFLNSSEIEKLIAVFPVTNSKIVKVEKYTPTGTREDESVAPYTEIKVIYIPSNKSEK